MIKKNSQELNQASNRILVGTSIEGEIKSNGDFRVDGSISGRIEISGKLVIGEKGSVDGEIVCANANVSGKFKGKLEVIELLSLQETAKVNGDITTGRLSIEPGAEFTGSCSMGSVVREINKDGESKSKRGKEAATA